MPTYEYACKECGQHLEVQQSFADASLTECPSCHGPLRKVFGNIAITFKGSGFYKTDSRTSSSPAAKSSDKSSDTVTSTSDKAGSTSDKSGSESSKPAGKKSEHGGKTEKTAKAPEAKAS